MINLLLNHKIFDKNPPILFDLGAGGDPKLDWKKLHRYSHIFKLDANKNIEDNKNKNSTIINEIVFDKKKKVNFNITKSVFCSSLLNPNMEELENWSFRNKFEIKRKLKVQTKTLGQVIRENKINKIDLIKLDLQGIDLKVFKSIPIKIRKKILLAEFEPGLYNFYKNEDKLSEILNFMENDYSIEEFVFSSSIKSNYKLHNSFTFLQRKSLNLINKKTKFYTNISFLRKKKFLIKKDLRSILLMLAILILKKRYTEALEIVKKYSHIDPIFEIIEKKIFFKIKVGMLLFFLSRPYYFLKKSFNFSRKFIF